MRKFQYGGALDDVNATGKKLTIVTTPSFSAKHNIGRSKS